jgi:hypothetical protein
MTQLAVGIGESHFAVASTAIFPVKNLLHFEYGCGLLDVENLGVA